MLTLLVLFLVCGGILVIVALPLLANKIKPNPIYGFRISPILENVDLWYPVNQYFAKWLLAAGLVTCLASTGLFFWPGISLDIYSLSCLGIFLVPFILGVLQSWKYSKKLIAGRQ